LTREDAIAEISLKTYSEESLREDHDFIIKKLGLSREAFADIMAAPNKSFKDYPTSNELRIVLSKIKDLIRRFGRCGR
jgi:hypothetical protein